MELEELFCVIDDFYQDFDRQFNSQLREKFLGKRNRRSRLTLSEVMTIMIYFHQSSYRNFKNFYQGKVQKEHQKDFPTLVSYNRFVELIPYTLIPLMYYLNSRKGDCTGISFIDGMGIPICHNKRAKRNKVFKGLAAWGKSSIDWYFGFKLHLIINEKGEILAFQITPGNIDERQPVPFLAEKLWGRMFGDKGYISKELFKELLEHNLKLVTPIKKNMKNKLMPIGEKLMLRKRSLIETVNDQLQNISQVVHSRHRSITNFMVNIMAGLIAYTHQEKKPSLRLENYQEIGSLALLI
jgi:Transposase DDE domain